MTFDSIAAVIFVVLLCFFLYRKRREIIVQKAFFPLLYVLMYRSSFGLKGMKRIAGSFPRSLKVLGIIGVVLGFAGMALIVVEMVSNTFSLFTSDDSIPGVQPVLPIQVKGVFFVPFTYWIISIFLIALVHEFAHGIVSNLYNVRVKSSGFAFVCLILPIIPAAFVEPDDKVLLKRRTKEQLSVFAAGPFSNVLFAVFSILLVLSISPLLSSAFISKGVEIVDVTKEGPAEIAGLSEGDVIVKIDDFDISSSTNLSSLLNDSKEGKVVAVKTLNKTINLTIGRNNETNSSFMGVQLSPYLEVNEEFTDKYGSFAPMILKWLSGLLFWLFMLNIGVGLFNLLPIGPLDGGRMFQLVCLRFFKKNTALRIWSGVSFFLIVLILANLFIGFLR